MIAAYASREGQPSFSFWPMLFDNLTIRLLGSDDFPVDAKRQAAADLTTAAADGALSMSFAEPFALDEIAAGHEAVEAGGAGRVVVRID